MRHGAYDDFWKARRSPTAFQEYQAAVMTVGGWYDAEDLYGALHVYKATECNRPGPIHILVMGPWSHCAWHGGDGEQLHADH